MSKGRKIWIAAGVVVLIGGLVWLNLRQAGGVAANAVAVRLLTVEPKEIAVRVLAPAALEAAEEVEVRSAVAAPAISLQVRAGDRVQAGDLLAVLDNRDLQARADQQRAALASARAQLAQLEQQAVVGPAQARERLASARVSLQLAEAGLERNRAALATQRRSAQDQVDRATAQLDSAAAALQAAARGQGDLDLAARQAEEAQAALDAALADLARTDPTTSPDLAEAELRVEQARVALRQAELDERSSGVLPQQLAAARQQVAAAERALAQAEADLAAARVTAPTAGVVMSVSVRDGQPVQPGLLLLVLADTDRLVALARVDEVDVAKVAVGQPVLIRSLAYTGEEFAGRVERVDPQGRRAGEGTAATYTVEIAVTSAGGKLRPGMNVDADIAVATRENALAVPLEAVRDEGGRKVVWVVDGEGRARRQQVTTGLSTRTEVEITSGLAAGTRIIPGPLRLLRELTDGQPVRPEQGGGDL